MQKYHVYLDYMLLEKAHFVCTSNLMLLSMSNFILKSFFSILVHFSNSGPYSY